MGPEPGDRRKCAFIRTSRDRTTCAIGAHARGQGAGARRGAAAQRAHAIRILRHPQLRLGRAGQKLTLVRAALRARGRAFRAEARSPGSAWRRTRSSYASQGCMRSWRPCRRRTGTSRGSSRSARFGSPGSTGCRGPRPSRREAGSRSIARTVGLEFELQSEEAESLVLRETFDPGWTALLDGKPVAIRQNPGVFLQIDIPAGDHNLILRIRSGRGADRPRALALSCIFLILVLTGIRMFRIPGITTRGGLDGAEPAG